MLLNPSVMALVLASAMVALMVMLASAFAVQVLAHWDIASGSARQLKLERRTYLISTLLTWAFVAELLSLLLFVHNAEAMSDQFVGAMCATGVLNLNAWGWPTLFLKIAVFFGGAVWLAMNRLDNQGHDYPLVRVKYALLLVLLPLVLAEFVVQLLHFSEMTPNVITSCCGALFSADAEGVAAQVSALSPRTALLALAVSGIAVLSTGVLHARSVRWGLPFAALSILAFGMALVGIVSLIALYVYEHPHHHCPFCLLKAGHDFVGYLLYVPLFTATGLALSGAVISRWQHIPSLADAAARERARFSWSAVILFALFYAVAAALVIASNLTMMEVWW